MKLKELSEILRGNTVVIEWRNSKKEIESLTTRACDMKYLPNYCLDSNVLRIEVFDDTALIFIDLIKVTTV